jgi:hypothetical protein
LKDIIIIINNLKKDIEIAIEMEPTTEFASNKRIINRLIYDAYSRKHGCSDTSEDWAFGLMYEDETIQLQATNCSRCGNYIYCQRMFKADCQKLMCKCSRIY